MSILPEELISEILSRLPAKSLLRFQCVSKAWFALIKDPTFINVHLKNNRRECTLLVQARHYENDRPLNWKHYLVNFSNVEDDEPVAVEAFLPILSFPEIIDCCNGLVCICDYKSNKIVILNPSIRKYKKLPSEPPFEPTVGASCFALRNFGFGYHPINNDYFALRDFGFGYDPINNDYKVLRIVEYFKSVYTNEAELLAGAIEVEVYSLKANSWRRVEDQWPYKKSLISSKPVYLNGALHWLVKTATRGIRLLAFHLTTEKFQDHTLTLPVEPQTLEVLGVSLCVSGFRPETQGIDFWMMKETSWSRHFTAPAYFRQVVFSTDDQTVLMVMDHGKDLLWYDIKKKTQSSVLRQIQTKIWTGTCVGSLVLLGGDI